MDTYCKVFGSLLTSSVWTMGTLAEKVVWITMLVMKDRDGLVKSSVPGVAVMAGVGLEECRAALGKFLAPDAESRTKDWDGRKIEVVEGVGWKVLNHERYRDTGTTEGYREYQRRKQAEYRKKKAMALSYRKAQEAGGAPGRGYEGGGEAVEAGVVVGSGGEV